MGKIDITDAIYFLLDTRWLVYSPKEIYEYGFGCDFADAVGRLVNDPDNFQVLVSQDVWFAIPQHEWIFYKGRHYDAMHPRGVKTWNRLFCDISDVFACRLHLPEQPRRSFDATGRKDDAHIKSFERWFARQGWMYKLRRMI